MCQRAIDKVLAEHPGVCHKKWRTYQEFNGPWRWHPVTALVRVPDKTLRIPDTPIVIPLADVVAD